MVCIGFLVVALCFGTVTILQLLANVDSQIKSKKSSNRVQSDAGSPHFPSSSQQPNANDDQPNTNDDQPNANDDQPNANDDQPNANDDQDFTSIAKSALIATFGNNRYSKHLTIRLERKLKQQSSSL